MAYIAKLEEVKLLHDLNAMALSADGVPS